MPVAEKENYKKHEIKKSNLALDDIMQNQEAFKETDLTDKFNRLGVNDLPSGTESVISSNEQASYFSAPLSIPFMGMPMSSMQVAPGFENVDAETQLKNVLKKQIEYYFSRQNLEKDGFLLSIMDDALSVPVARIAGFSRVARLTTDVNLVMKVMQESSKLDVNVSDMTVKPILKPERLVLVIEQLPSATGEDFIWELFEQEPLNRWKPSSISLKDDGVAEIAFESEGLALKAHDHLKKQKVNEDPVAVRFFEAAPFSPPLQGPPFPQMQAHSNPPMQPPFVFVYPYNGVAPFAPPSYGRAPMYNYGYPQYNAGMPSIFMNANMSFGRSGSDNESMMPSGFHDSRYTQRKPKHQQNNQQVYGNQSTHGKPNVRKMNGISKGKPHVAIGGQVTPPQNGPLEDRTKDKIGRPNGGTTSPALSSASSSRQSGLPRANNRSNINKGLTSPKPRTASQSDPESNGDVHGRNGRKGRAGGRKFVNGDDGKNARKPSPGRSSRDDNVSRQAMKDLALNPANFPPLVNSAANNAFGEGNIPKIHNVWLEKSVADSVKAPPSTVVSAAPSVATSPIPTSRSASPTRQTPIPSESLVNQSLPASSNEPSNPPKNVIISSKIDPVIVYLENQPTEDTASFSKTEETRLYVKKGPSSYASILKQSKE